MASHYDPTAPLSSAVPLGNAVSQASAVEAGRYRYYSFVVGMGSLPATQLSIAVTQSSSDAYILVSMPGNPALPTLDAADATSFGSTLQLVTVLQPAPGSYSLGVWSASATSFTITAFSVGTQSIQPLVYGVVYPGFVLENALQFFSVYMDPLQRVMQAASVRVTLYSLTGDADLFCSITTTYPSPGDSYWSSTREPGELDQVSIPTAQLGSNTLYCAVRGFYDSSYTLAASLQTPLLLSPEDVTFLQVAAGEATPVFISLYGNTNTSGLVVISVAAQYGATSLYANGYPRAAVASRQGSQWVSDLPQALQALPLVISDVCAAGAIARSDPPQCGINLLVVSLVPSLYRIAVETSNSGAFLVPGEPYPGAVLGGGLFMVQISVPNNFINATLLVTMAGDLDNASLSVGRNSWNRNSSLWTVTQTAGNPLIVWSLDWTDPRLTPRGAEQGRVLRLHHCPLHHQLQRSLHTDQCDRLQRGAHTS